MVKELLGQIVLAPESRVKILLLLSVDARRLAFTLLVAQSRRTDGKTFLQNSSISKLRQ